MCQVVFRGWYLEDFFLYIVDPRWCRGCHKWVANNSFVYGSNGLDKDCFYIWQCIWRICKSQNKLDWLAEVRSNDVKVKHCIDHYRTHRQAVSTANNRGASNTNKNKKNLCVLELLSPNVRCYSCFSRVAKSSSQGSK